MSESLFKTLFNMVSEHTLSSKIFWWPNSVHTLPLKPSAARMTTPTINVSHTSPKNQENPNSNQSDTSAQTSFDQNQGYLNPYFLHHNDNTNLVLVTEQLTEENYVSWSRAMTIGLSVKNKIGFVDGTIARPTGDLLPVWIRNNNIVISWILNSVSKPISANILFSDLARTIWVELKERFQKKNAPRIFQLKRSLATLSQNQDSIGMYFTKFKTLFDELNTYRPACNCGTCTCDGLKEMADFLQMEYLVDFLWDSMRIFSRHKLNSYLWILFHLQAEPILFS